MVYCFRSVLSVRPLLVWCLSIYGGIGESPGSITVRLGVTTCEASKASQLPPFLAPRLPAFLFKTPAMDSPGRNNNQVW